MSYVAAADRYERLPYRRCGRSGLQLPVISLGLWQNFGDVSPLATQRWESLDAAGRNEFLRSNTVRAVVSRDEMPPIESQEGPLTPLDIPRTAIINKPDLYAVIYLGNLGDILRRAGDLAATVLPS